MANSLSPTASERFRTQFIGQVADELAVSGIHAFGAHDTMEYEEPWQDQMGLRAALHAADNYMDAGATAKRIATIDTLTQAQWTELAEIYRANDQVGRARLIDRALAPYYRAHDQS